MLRLSDDGCAGLGDFISTLADGLSQSRVISLLEGGYRWQC